MKRSSHKKIIAYSLAVFITFCGTACSFNDVSFYFKSDSEKQEYLYRSPKFWDDAVATDKSDNLSLLHRRGIDAVPVFFESNTVKKCPNGVFSANE